MKLTATFKSFLQDTVNLNDSRITSLESSVEAIKNFIRQSEYKPKFVAFHEQGSWAHETIIKPLNGDEFDADLLLAVEPVDGWSASDYIANLGKVFSQSATYKDKTKVHDFCVTIVYAGDKRIDIAPLVKNRAGVKRYEVCDRANNAFELSEPMEYTAWIKERNGYSGSNSFRKVTRLVKYIRDIKGTFTCPSVLLTTLIGNQIDWYDQGSAAFSDTPTTLKTLLGRLDDWLQARPSKPKVQNPKLATEDFARQLTDDQYANLRKVIKRYRTWVDDAYDEIDRDESIRKWQRVFGADFAKGEVVTKAVAPLVSPYRALLDTTARHSSDLVEAFYRFGAKLLPTGFYTPPYLRQPSWRTNGHVSENVYVVASWHRHKNSGGRRIEDGEILPSNGGVWLAPRVGLDQEVPDNCRVEWRVTNTGVAALTAQAGRGDFYTASTGNKRWEELRYRGVHFVEAFIVLRAGDILVGKSKPFHVVIE